jgi:tRNA/tmRNA/rRNA uracil-C5-methylase (TrmA/RlmC/RlmD family)
MKNIRRKKPSKKLSTLSGPAETLELEITDLSASGAGVARDESGRVIFVPYSIPGDLLRVNVKAVTKRYAQAEIVEILRASTDRRTPKCPVFGRCGGCQWQHVPYELQFRTKARGLVHALERRQIVLEQKFEELPAEQVWEYRNRVQLRGNGSALGFYASGSHEIVPIERCEIARPEINDALSRAREQGASRGSYKLELDVSPEGGLRESWNARHSALGFRQVHDGQNEKLRSWVASCLTPGRVLLDLFGGSGNLSLPVAERMSEVHCVDLSVPHSHPTISFHRSAVRPWLEKQVSDKKLTMRIREAGGTAILDPPREGLDSDFDAIESALRKLGITELVAVGCDPSAWAQDLSRLLHRGWRIERVAALDLFPQTPHVEGIALLRL